MSAHPPLLPEVWHNICSHLAKPSLSRLRLTCSALAQMALPHLFRSILLEASDDSVERFVSLAKSPKHAALVRELTIDTWIHDHEYHCNGDYEFPYGFMQALPFLRAFSKTTALHLRFSEHCGDEERSGYDIEETPGYRHRVLDTVFHCVAGMWTLDRQRHIDVKMNEVETGDWSPYSDIEFSYDEPALLALGDDAFQLKELTVTNLEDYLDKDLYSSSEAWRAVVSQPSLVDLKLFVANEHCDASPEANTFYDNQYDFFGSLSTTWLSPDLARNLRVLSLYSRNYWGWFPRPDMIRNVELPQLKVLALGNFVFTHEREVEWFASLGRENGSGGLEELYLDDCPVLFEARQHGPLGEDGYPIVATVMDSTWPPIEATFALRWHHILPRWAESMKGLRLFCTGHSDWDGFAMLDEPLEGEEKPDDPYEGQDEEKIFHRYSQSMHRTFAGNLNREEREQDVYRGSVSAAMMYGRGISRSRGGQMQYITYDIGVGPSPWCELSRRSRDEDDVGSEPEEGTGAKDTEAYEALMAVVSTRAGTSKR